MARILGLDPGQRKIGVAISDDDGRVALPRAPILVERTDEALPRIAAIVEAEGVVRVVVGLPLTLRGERGREAAAAQQFIRDLEEHVRLPVDFEDERLTSREAQRNLRARPGRIPRGVEDSIAATLMLQSYLDRRKREEQ